MKKTMSKKTQKTKQSANANLAARLRRRGFDRSRTIPFGGGVRVGCSQCVALVINGIACHEHGCPNQQREQDNDDE